jgi:hypothetical protein
LTTGIIILIFLFTSYFIKVEVDSGANFIIEDSILGIIIFHNILFLGIYVMCGIFLILIGLSRRKNEKKQRKNYK